MVKKSLVLLLVNISKQSNNFIESYSLQILVLTCEAQTKGYGKTNSVEEKLLEFIIEKIKLIKVPSICEECCRVLEFTNKPECGFCFCPNVKPGIPTGDGGPSSGGGSTKCLKTLACG